MALLPLPNPTYVALDPTGRYNQQQVIDDTVAGR